jgi:hypothetical protein
VPWARGGCAGSRGDLAGRGVGVEDRVDDPVAVAHASNLASGARYAAGVRIVTGCGAVLRGGHAVVRSPRDDFDRFAAAVSARPEDDFDAADLEAFFDASELEALKREFEPLAEGSVTSGRSFIAAFPPTSWEDFLRRKLRKKLSRIEIEKELDATRRAEEQKAPAAPESQPRLRLPPLPADVNVFAFASIQKAARLFDEDESINCVAELTVFNLHDASRLHWMLARGFFRVKDGRLLPPGWRVGRRGKKYALRIFDEAAEKWIDPAKIARATGRTPG